MSDLSLSLWLCFIGNLKISGNGRRSSVLYTTYIRGVYFNFSLGRYCLELLLIPEWSLQLTVINSELTLYSIYMYKMLCYSCLAVSVVRLFTACRVQ